jgi:probable phosphoglycerate mutase
VSTLTLVRHGETEWSRSGQHTGTTDVPLTEQGRTLATKLEAALRGQAYALVLTSPLSRARDTAAIAGFGDAIVDDDLREWDYGEYEGLTTPQIRERRPGWFLWEDGVPGGETIKQVAARVDRVIAKVRAQDGDALLFAHGHLLRILSARWLDEDPGFGRHLVLSPATISVLGWEREAPAIEVWNSPAL